MNISSLYELLEVFVIYFDSGDYYHVPALVLEVPKRVGGIVILFK